MLDPYWRIWWHQTLTDATGALGLNWPTVMRVVFVLGAGVLLSRLISVDLAVDVAWRGLVNVVAAHLIVLGAVLIVFGVLAPARIHAQQRSVIDHLLTKKRATDLAESLGRHDEIAVHRFWAKHPKTGEIPEMAEWFEGLDQWTKELYRLMEDGGCDYLEIKSVRVLGNLQPYMPPVGGFYHQHHDINKALIKLNARRVKLAEIIKKYSDRMA